MVGVPGRSKGCNTCIQRKIRCDQAQPTCGNCYKSHRLCTGYQRKLGFVVSQNVDLDEASSEPGLEETIVMHQGRWRRSSRPTKQKTSSTHLPSSAAVLPTDALLARHVSIRDAIRQQYLEVYLHNNLPVEIRDGDRSPDAMPMNWLLALQSISVDSEALESCVGALCAARVGRRNRDTSLVEQSRSMYMTGLRQLQDALKDPQRRLSDGTLGACMALAVYELTERPRGVKKAYLTHQRGSLMLLRMRGPESLTTPLGYSMFLGIRTQAIIECIAHRHDLFLSHPEWREIPFKSRSKVVFDRFLDCMWQIPAILERSDRLREEKDAQKLYAGIEEMIAMCQALDSQLQACYHRMEKSVTGPLYWPQLSSLRCPADNTADGQVFPVSFHFPAFFVAQAMIVYWLSLLEIHNMLDVNYRWLAEQAQLSRSGVAASSSAAAGREASRQRSAEMASSMARNICQTVEYMLQDKMGGLGAYAMLSPLAGVWSAMEAMEGDHTREFAWIRHFVNLLERKCNFEVQDLWEEEPPSPVAPVAKANE